MTFMKPRAMPEGRSFGAQGRRLNNAARSGAGARRGPITGEYNSFWPREDIAIWFALCPGQAWEFDMYDRESGDVVHLADQYYFYYKEHFIARTKRRFNCSAGADRGKPCWGCGVQNAHWDRVRAVEEDTGVKPSGMAAIGGSPRFAISGVLLEPMGKVQVMKDGAPRLTRDGKPIMRDTPLCTLPTMEAKKLKNQGVTTFGLPVHFSANSTQLNELLAFDTQLKNQCGTCAGDLFVLDLMCPECAEMIRVVDDPNSPATGEDLTRIRAEEIECSSCDYVGKFQPVVNCECGNPVEGSVVHFALRLKVVKTGEKTRQLHLVEFKPIGAFTEKYPAVVEMLENPLDLPAIFAATNLEFQKKLVPPELRGEGVSPLPRKSEEAAESYELSDKKKPQEEPEDDDVPY